MEKYDLIIVGAGPAGIFTAVELLRHGSKKKILLVEKGKPVEKRHCPKAELGHCVNCRPTCAITTGFSGAGAFSDGKLSLSYEVGGDLPSLIGEEFAQELIHYTDKIYLEFGADPHVEGIYTGEDIKEIRKNAIHAGLKLVDCPIRHLGTEKAQELYLAIQNYLADNGVEMRFNTECENIILEEEGCKGVLLKDGDSLVISGDYQRYFEYDGVRYAHLIDLTTGYPARYVSSVAVLARADTGGLADALSTGLFCLPEETGQALAAQNHYAVLWMHPDETTSRSADWPQ